MKEPALRISVDKGFFLGLALASLNRPLSSRNHNKVLWTGPRDFDNHGVRQPV